MSRFIAAVERRGQHGRRKRETPAPCRHWERTAWECRSQLFRLDRKPAWQPWLAHSLLIRSNLEVRESGPCGDAHLGPSNSTAILKPRLLERLGADNIREIADSPISNSRPDDRVRSRSICSPPIRIGGQPVWIACTNWHLRATCVVHIQSRREPRHRCRKL